MFTGVNTYTGATTIDSGATLQIGNGGTGGVLSTSSSMTNNGTLAFNRTNTMTQGTDFNSLISGTGALTQAGSGTLVLNGTNTYTGATTVNTGGVLNIQNANALGTTAEGTTVTSGAALQIQGGITTGAEALTLRGAGVSTDGALRNISGTNTYAGLVTLGAATRINSDAGTLTLSNAGTITGAGLGLSVGGVGNTTIASIIGTTSGTLSKDGAGTLTLSGANTFTGATTVSTGVLNIRHANALGTAAAGTSVTSGAALQIQGGITTDTEALTLNGTGVSGDGALRNISGTNTYAGLVTLGAATRINSDTGTLTLSNAGTITGDTFGLTVGGSTNTKIASIIGTGTGGLTKDGGGTLTLSGANTYDGGTTVTAGILNIQNANALGTTASGTSVASGASLQIQGDITTAAEALTLAGTTGALRNVSGTNTYAGLVTLGAETRITSDAGTLTLSNTGTITGNTFNLQVDGVGNTTIASIIGTGTGSLTKFNTGTLTLSGANTYTGATSVNAGVLNIQNDNALGTTGGGAVVFINAALQIQGGITVNEALGLRGTGRSNDGALRNMSGDNNYSGLVTLGATARINSDAGTLTLSNAGTITGSGLGLSVGGASNTTIASIIGTGAGTLTKDGAGTLTLSGANTYTGTTTVSAGTLEVSGASGALTATSAVNINGGTLLLSGSAANRISNTAAISLGAATGSTLQLSGAVTETLGALTLAGGAGIRVIDFGATSGVLTFASLTATSSLPVQIWNWSGNLGIGGGTDRLFITSGAFGGSLAASDISFFSGPGTGLYSGTTAFTSGGELVPVPEASTLLAVLGLMAPLAWRERRHWMRCREARGN